MNIVELNAYLGVATVAIYGLVIIVLLAKKGIPHALKSYKRRKIECMECDLEDRNNELNRAYSRIERLKVKLNMMDKNRSLSLEEVNNMFEIKHYED